MTTPTPLKVPTIQAEPGPLTRSGHSAIAEWLGELPQGNPDACAATLMQVIHKTNRAPLQRTTRFKVAEQFRPVINRICDALVKRYRNSGLPLDPEAERQAHAINRLQRELTVAFRHAVNDFLVDGRTTVERRREAPVAFQRALLAQGRALLEAYRIYQPEPQGFWRSLHTLYGRAEALQMQAAPIEGDKGSDETALSVKQAYLRTVILSLANPYHLMQGEAEELYRRIGRWAHFIRLHVPKESDSLSGRFVLDLGSDFPPHYRAAQQKHHLPMSSPRLLEIGQLSEALDQQIAYLDDHLRQSRHANTLSERMQRNMYARFQNALAGRQERTHARQSSMGQVRMVSGLSPCHFMLNGKNPFQPEEDEARWRRKVAGASGGQEGLALVDDSDDNPDNGMAHRTARFKSFDVDADDVWTKANRINIDEEPTEAQTSTPRIQSVTLRRKNLSEGGMALLHPQGCTLRTRVGELVAYGNPNDPETPESWRLATIRWLRTQPEQGIEIGLEFIDDSAHAAASKAISGPGNGSAYLRTLIVPRVNPMMESTTLITPASVYDVGTRLALNLGELVLNVQLTDMIGSTRLYAHFRFKIIPANER